MNMTPVYSQMGLLFFSVLLGFLSAKTRVSDERTNSVISNIVMDITLPCTVLYSSLNSERLLNNTDLLYLLGYSLITIAILVLESKLISFVLRLNGQYKSISEFEVIFSNSAFVGYPLMRLMFGQDSIFYAALITMVFTVFCNSYGISLLQPKEAKENLKLKSLATPVLLSSVIAVIIYVFKIRIPQYSLNLLAYVDQITGPLSMMMVGISMAFAMKKFSKGSAKICISVLLRMLTAPLIILFVLPLFGANEYITAIMAIIVSLPSAVSTTMFCAKYGSDQEAASTGIVVSTIASAIIVPLIYQMIMAYSY